MPSNFFDNIMASLRGASGKADATEAELDQFAAELPTAESLAIAASEQAETKFGATISALTTQVAELEAQLSDPSRTSLMDDLTAKVTTLQTELDSVTAANNSKTIQIAALSRDLATAKVAYKPKAADQPADAMPAVPDQSGAKTEKHGDATVTKTAHGTTITSTAWSDYAASKARKN